VSPLVINIRYAVHSIWNIRTRQDIAILHMYCIITVGGQPTRGGGITSEFVLVAEQGWDESSWPHVRLGHDHITAVTSHNIPIVSTTRMHAQSMHNDSFLSGSLSLNQTR